MQLKKDFEHHKLYLIDNNKKLVEFGFVGDEYTIIFYTDKKVPITKEIDSDFYDSYKRILSNSYIMLIPFSSQTDNRIIWFSDGCCDLDDKWQTDAKSRLCIEEEGDQIFLSAINPFFDQYPFQNNPRVVILSPAGNGHFSKNVETLHTFQDDIIMIHQQSLSREKILEKYRDYLI